MVFLKGPWVSYVYQFKNRNIDGEMCTTIYVFFKPFCVIIPLGWTPTCIPYKNSMLQSALNAVYHKAMG